MGARISRCKLQTFRCIRCIFQCPCYTVKGSKTQPLFYFFIIPLLSDRKGFYPKHIKNRSPQRCLRDETWSIYGPHEGGGH